MKYLWLLNETIIAEFNSYDEAVEELNRMPENFEVSIGNKTSTVPRRSIVVCPEELPNLDPLTVEDSLANFLNTFFK